MVTFKTKAYASIPMLGDVAKQMLEMMKFGTDVPGAIVAEDVAAARDNLKQALAAMPEIVEPAGDDEGDQPAVSLHTRAFPLLELLDAAVADEEHVRWE